MKVDEENKADSTVEPQAASASNLRPRLFWTFGTQSLALLLRIVQQILLVPVLIRAWGPDLYADWIIIFSATSSLVLLDFGMQFFFGNAMLIAWSKGDKRAYRRYFATAMGIYAVVLVSAIAALAVASLMLSWPAYLGTRVLSAQSTLITAGILALTTLSLIPFGIVTGIYRAHGDYSRGTLISILAEAARGFGIVFLALLGGTPVIAAIVYLAVALFWAFVAFDQWRLYGEPLLSFALPTMAEANYAVKQSSLYFIPSMTTTAVLNGPILLLATIGSSPGAVVAFTVVRTFTGFLRQVVEQFCHAIGAE